MRLALGLVFYLIAAIARAGLEDYPSLVVANKTTATSSSDGIQITYLGVNGYQFEAGGHTLLVDPYFSRIGFWKATLNGTIAPDISRVDGALTHLRRNVEAILVTHAHFDHLLDVPEIMTRTHARLIAGPTAAHLTEATGISPNQCEIVRPGTVKRIGPWTIQVFSATHDRIFGSTPFPGAISGPVLKPAKASDWKLGEPLAFVIEANAKRIYIDSGGMPGHLPAPSAHHVDLAIVGTALPDSRERYAEIVRQLQPKYVLPSHQDDFFAPIESGFAFGRLTNFPEIIRIHQTAHLPGRLILMDYFRPWTLR